MKHSDSIKERFMAHVAQGPGCWLWQASTMNSGYGQFGHRGTMRQAHRVSYELHVGPIPAGLSILHSCDDKLCVNPAHLRPGTHSENIKEAYSRGRRAKPDLRGENHPRASITFLDAIRMRDLRSAGMAVTDIARRYGVKRSLVSDVVTGRCWRQA
jgi:hypothetical protein